MLRDVSRCCSASLRAVTSRRIRMNWSGPKSPSCDGSMCKAVLRIESQRVLFSASSVTSCSSSRAIAALRTVLDWAGNCSSNETGIGRDAKQPSGLGIHKNDAVICVDHNHAARQGIQNALQRCPNVLVFRQARGESCIPLFEFASQPRDFALKLAVRSLHPAGRGHERIEGLRQRAFGGARRRNHWSVMRSRQHMPTCSATRMPNRSNSQENAEVTGEPRTEIRNCLVKTVD